MGIEIGILEGEAGMELSQCVCDGFLGRNYEGSAQVYFSEQFCARCILLSSSKAYIADKGKNRQHCNSQNVYESERERQTVRG